jgi:hypothetical protein
MFRIKIKHIVMTRVKFNFSILSHHIVNRNYTVKQKINRNWEACYHSWKPVNRAMTVWERIKSQTWPPNYVFSLWICGVQIMVVRASKTLNTFADVLCIFTNLHALTARMDHFPTKRFIAGLSGRYDNHI